MEENEEDLKLLCRVGMEIDQIDTGGLPGNAKTHLRLDMSAGGINLPLCNFSSKAWLSGHKH